MTNLQGRRVHNADQPAEEELDLCAATGLSSVEGLSLSGKTQYIQCRSVRPEALEG